MRLSEPGEGGRLDPFVGVHVWHAAVGAGSRLEMPAGHVMQPCDILLGRVEAGSGALEGESGRAVPLAAGNVACALAGSPRGRLEVRDAPLRVTVLLCGSQDTSRETISTLETFGVGLAPLVRHLRGGVRVIDGSAELTRLFREVDESLAACDEQRCRLAVVSLLREVGAALAREARATRDGRDAELAESACGLMARDLSVTLTIGQLAQALGVSPSTLKRAFSRAEGTSVRAWLTDRRMQRACELLADGSRTVTDVAYAVGYANPSKFSHAFAARMGKTPSEWRAAR